MVKKIYFQSIFFSFFFIKEAFAAESGGMPQLNPEFWVSQIFWLILTFGIMYLVLSKLILPKISNNLESRKSQILENIEAAEKQREECPLSDLWISVKCGESDTTSGGMLFTRLRRYILVVHLLFI